MLSRFSGILTLIFFTLFSANIFAIPAGSSDDSKEFDVNEMIMNGMSTSKVEDIISKNTYNKLSALTKLSIWKKV